MAEQRPIDANKLRPIHIENYGEAVDWSSIEYADEVDSETLPIVQQLRAELWKAKAERDAAVKNRAKLAEYELTVCEEFCYGDAQHDIPPCEWFVGGKCALREWVKAND